MKPLGIFSGLIKRLPSATTLETQASATGAASLNVPHGTAPSSPQNGDMWTTASGIFVQINGSTVGLLGTGGGGGVALDGAKVRKSAILTGQNLTAGATAVTWNSEDWDTASYHDNVTNSNRLTITNAGYYRVICLIRLDNVTSGNWVLVEVQRRNSSGVFQEIIGANTVSAPTTIFRVQAVGTALFAAGDYVEVYPQVSADTSVDIHNSSYLEIQRVG